MIKQRTLNIKLLVAGVVKSNEFKWVLVFVTTRVSSSSGGAFSIVVRTAGGDAEETGDKLRLGELEPSEPKASDPTVDNTEVGDWLSLSEGETDLLVGSVSFPNLRG